MVNIPIEMFLHNMHKALDSLPWGRTIETVMSGLEELETHFETEHKKIEATRSRDIEGAITYCDSIDREDAEEDISEFMKIIKDVEEGSIPETFDEFWKEYCETYKDKEIYYDDIHKKLLKEKYRQLKNGERGTEE